MIEAIQKFWEGESVPSTEDLYRQDSLTALLEKAGLESKADLNWGKLLELLFEHVVEEHLIQPTFIYDFPTELSPLSKTKDADPRLAERFELFNAYSELNDPQEQRKRFKEQVEARARGDSEAHEMDEDYLNALQYGMPPTAGEGIGIDRLTMVLTDSNSIREVILFPHLRPKS
jgi:lysyl-tRNA synthetase class 2